MPDNAPTSDRPRVIVIGGGLAGLAAASVLAPRGFNVTLLESRPRLGGRASSIVDRETGRTIDNCQHVTMGCCTSFRHFCETTGCADLFDTQKTLHFVEPPHSDRPPRIIPFRGIPLPAPAHLSLALARMPWFSFAEKRAIARGLRALSRDLSSETDDSKETFAEWLTRHGQPEPVQTRFWHTVLVSALSETLDRISVRHARKVFVDGFLSNRRGWEVSIPTAPLGEIYDERIARPLREA
ncbi:MAG: FAD-dependent oxidoreductase, partial [Planctomycetes bacterium]|nr:FAD-dependent oxidoreductase [Planctomycetota bacterium]